MEEKKKAPVADEELPLCHRPAKTGLCQAYFPRYFYDKNSGTCRKFVYGGCQSNGNNFETEQECLQTCQAMAAVLQKIDLDPEQQLYTPKIVDIAADVMEMHGDI
ncbi:SPINT3 [Cordylochernes scorpioides]|uniref:SPINT3 n=1 Tax=Cordylochernes scorpioides TaxID=51811 RepID=A0ABY6L010_9ARAC|nr:SPINT3 [Cordylochernes scorpioides]